MRYMGGKHRLAKHIAPYIHARLGDRVYVEPFCGALNVAAKVKARRMVLNDLAPCLTELFAGVRDGSIALPDAVSEEEYAAYKAEARAGRHTPLGTFAGFGASFSGIFFGSYAKSSDSRCYPAEAARGLRRKITALGDAEIEWTALDYRDLALASPSLIYCDPPYADTSGYSATGGGFDSEAFWDQCRAWARDGHIVLVSEETAPPDITEIAHWRFTRGLRDGGGQAVVRYERLYEVPREV